MVECPKCDATMDVEEEDITEGESLICEECGARLTVVGLDPLDPEEESSVKDDEDEDLDDEDEDEDELNEEEEGEEEEDEDEDDDWR